MMRIIQVIVIVSLSCAAAAGVEQCCSDNVKINSRNNTCTDGKKISLRCPDGYYRLDPKEDEDQFWLLKNGTVMLHDGYELHEYCMSSVTENETSRPIAIVCFEWEIDPLQLTYLIIMILSVPFLIATIVVYASIPTLRDINGKCIIGYVASLAMSYMLVVSRHFKPGISFELCAIRGAVLYYSTMSTFAWLNLITFNLWRCVRNKIYQMTDKKLFYVYLSWGVGLPLFLCSLVVLLDFIPGSRVKGHFTIFDCWYEDSFGFYALLYAPMTTLIIFNIIMFIHCCWVLWKGYRDPTQSRIRSLRFKCLFTLRLCLLSGVPWILDCLSLAMEGVPQLRHVWFAFDCINAGQGFVIFIISIACHKRALKAIHQYRLCGFNWPDSWNVQDEDSATVSDVDKVAMEQIKENST